MSVSEMTVLLMVGALILLTVWDIYAEIKVGDPATISVILREASRKNLAIPFGLGLLCGHWFWN